ncbi:MAG TPA: hypothetical protein DF699_16360 [Phycisphaerales bacterium]|nr:hypothetical protein [Phycisphaerales bacterium]
MLYIACATLMLVAPKELVVRFFNSVMHGLDVESFVRWDMPWWEAIVGTVEVILLGWLFGALIASLYNLAVGRRSS